MKELDPEEVKRLGLTPGVPGMRELTAAEMKLSGLDPGGPRAQSVLGDAGVTIGSIGAQFNEGLAQSVDMIPQMGRWIRRQFDSSIPPLEAKDPGGVRTALKSLDIPVGDLETQKREYGVEDGPVRRIGGTAAKIAGQSAPFAALGPVGPAIKGTALAAGLGAVGQELGGDTGETIGVLASIPLALRYAGTRAARPPVVPTADELSAQARAAYDAADRAGVIIAQPALQRFEARLAADMARQGMDDILHPRVARVMARVADDAARGHMTLPGSEILRRVMRSAASSADASERRLAMRMINRLDDFVTNLRPTDLLAGNRAGIAELQNARRMWSRSAKSETITELMDRARVRAPNFSASGLENSLRVEFRQLALNPRRMRLFNQAEQAAIRRVAMGGPIDNALRFIGRFSPKGVLTGAMHGANIMSNPALGIPLAGATMGARYLATQATHRNARLADELMRRGYPVPPQLRRFLNLDAAPAVLGATASQISQ